MRRKCITILFCKCNSFFCDSRVVMIRSEIQIWVKKKQRSPGKRKLKEGDEMQNSEEAEAGTRGELQKLEMRNCSIIFDVFEFLVNGLYTHLGTLKIPLLPFILQFRNSEGLPFLPKPFPFSSSTPSCIKRKRRPDQPSRRSRFGTTANGAVSWTIKMDRINSPSLKQSLSQGLKFWE